MFRAEVFNLEKFFGQTAQLVGFSTAGFCFTLNISGKKDLQGYCFRLFCCS